MIRIDAEAGTIDLDVAEDVLAERRKAWKARVSDYGSGALWRYAQNVGPAYKGAVTHPGAAAETHDAAPCALHRERTDRPLATGDGQLTVENVTGGAGQLHDGSAEYLDALAGIFEIGTRGWVERANLAFDLDGGSGEVDPRLGFVDLRRVSDALLGLCMLGKAFYPEIVRM